MTKCFIRGCNSNTRKNDEGLSFFRFPRNEDLKKKWMDNIGAENIKPSAALRICSKHFAPNDVNRTLDVVRLKEDVVPSIFPFTPPSVTQIALPMKTNNIDNMALPDPTTSRLPPAVEPCTENIVPPCNPMPMVTNIIQPNRTKQLQPTNMDVNLSRTRESSMVPKKPKNIEKLHRQLMLQRKKIKVLNQKCRRLKQKLKTSQTVIEKLKKQSVVPHEGAVLLEECAGSPEIFTRPYFVKIMGPLYKCSPKQKHIYK